MDEYSDLNTSSESEFDFDQGSTHISDYDEPSENLEPELGETIYDDEYGNVPWNQQAQLQAQLNTARLRQLHADIKARA